MSEPSNEPEKKEDEIAKIFGKQFSDKFYQQVQQPKPVPLSEDIIRECTEFAKANMDGDTCKINWKGKYDIIFVTTPPTENSMRTRKLEKTGAISIAFLFRLSPNGWIGAIFQDPEQAATVQPNKMYFVIGKYSTNKVEGVDLPRIKARALVPLN